MRRRLEVLALLVAMLAASTPAWAARLEPFLSGLSSPLFLTHARDGSGRVFIVEQPGVIQMVPPGSSTPSVFLDIRHKIAFGGEQGLLGLTFHPAYALNGRLFVFYTRLGDGALVIAEYLRSADPAQASVASERILLTIPHPTFPNHNGGMLEFGPDGLLYIGVGDGGSAFDPSANAQNSGVLLGKVLRIDVDAAGGPLAYGIPASNPFASGGGAPEIWALGLRNPFRFSFDRASGTLLAGDVGQGSFEEIDVIVGGGNYGWNALEGNQCTGRGPVPCVPQNFVPPLAEYFHDGGRCSVTGGYVYRGAMGALEPGTYVFGDFCTGEIFTTVGSTPVVLLDTELLISSFGEDEAGELYVVNLGGTVERFVPSAPLELFVTGLYAHLLGRLANASEVKFWASMLSTSCASPRFASVIGGFLESSEFRILRTLSLSDQVAVLYRSILGREPDTLGLSWVDVLRQARLRIMRGFLTSEEFQSRGFATGDRTRIETFVLRLYGELLHRSPAPFELALYTDFILATGNVEAAVTSFIVSSEFEAQPLTSRDFATLLYRALLAREPDPDGLDGWEGVLRTTLLEIAGGGFVPSQEFQARIPALCS